jgi:hypothetical protein
MKLICAGYNMPLFSVSVECILGKVAAIGLLDVTLPQAAVLAHANDATVGVVVPVPAELVEDFEEVHHQGDGAFVSVDALR